MSAQMNLTLPHPDVHIHSRKATTASLAVASYFGKSHFHVMRDIEKIVRSANLRSETESGHPDLDGQTESNSSDLRSQIEFARKHFELSSYVDQRGKTHPMYEMTKNGFTLLVMGYTGPKAMRFKIDYIEEFDRMQLRLENGLTTLSLATERAWFEDHPLDKEIRSLVTLGYPYKFISRRVGRCASTIGRRVLRMERYGLMRRRSYRFAGRVQWATSFERLA